ncbi:MAG TPA: hypothetical protein VGD46_14745 [Rhizobacter sp.]
MKINLSANELHSATIEKVSLVKHGANRRPFAILKSEPLPESHKGLAERVLKAFEPKGAPKITGVFVSKAAAPKVFPLLKAAGLRVEADHAEALEGGVVVLKQDGYDADGEGSLVAINEDVAVAFDRVVKDFCTWHASSDFSTTLASQTFYPSVRMSMDALMETFWACAADSKTQEEFSGKVETALKAFSKHVAGLAKVLPVEVFKMEQKLAGDFEGSTVTATNTETAKTEGADMRKTNTREAVFGDLAGLFDNVNKSDEAGAADAGAAAATDTAATGDEANTEATDAAAAAAAAAQGTADVTDPAAAATAGAEGTGEGADTGAEDLSKGAVSAGDIIKALKETVGPMAVMLKQQGEKLDELSTANAALTQRLDAIDAKATAAVEKAEQAVTKADNTVVVHKDALDLSTTLHSRTSQSRVTKSNAPAGETDVFKGLIPAFDALEAKARGEQ